jgi:hypothetical protein
MQFKKKFFVKFATLISVKIVVLFTANAVTAKTYENSLSSLPATYTTNNSNKFTQSKLPVKSASLSNLKIPEIVAMDPLGSPESVSTPERGTPSLRRQPTGGERFEPKRIPLLVPLSQPPYRSSPSITIMNPSAYGAFWGTGGIGIGLQERVRFKDESDGVIGIGFGLGNPQKNVGAQIGISLVDISDPFQDGAINFKLHRRLPLDFSAAIGVQGATTWGNTDGGSSVYGVVTKRFKLNEDRTKPFSEIYTTVGAGGGQFRSESNIDNGDETIGVFGSLALKMFEPVGFVAEWTGQDLTLGTPLVLFRNVPLVIVPAITDITGTAGDGTRFIFGVGYTFSF